MSLPVLVSLFLLISTGCSLQDSVIPGGSKSQVLESKLPREKITQLPSEGLGSLTSGNNTFALDLYQRLQDQSGNIFFSPYSISSALAMTYAGAKGETAAEMAETLHFLIDQEKLHPSFNALDQYLDSLADQDIPEDQGDPFQLSIANAIWGQDKFHFEEDFLNTLAKNYGAGLRLLDFIMEPEESRQVINDWISDQTREKIQDLIPQGAINSDTRLVLSNAIYFKATWLEPFVEIFTDAGLFTGLDGEKIPITMMHGSDFNFLYFQGDGFQAFQMPYVGGEVSMLVILPDEGDYRDFESALTVGTLDQILEGMVYTPIRLTFPKFEFESEISLAQILADMGMPLAFSDAADFSGMIGTKDLFISDVFHKAYVNVDEEGTEAAAATAVIMSVTSAPADPLEITVDRSFLFVIREHQTNTILFMGRVVEP